MLAPSGGGLIIYQAYGNLYAMIGRKAYLLEDKQIPSVGVFDEVFSTWMDFGGNTHDLGSFGEQRDKITVTIRQIQIVMENPNHPNEPNEENPVIPEPNHVEDAHDPNEMVDIPDNEELVEYDRDDEEDPEE
ncbi:hypothetical protein Tco_0661073 [Tanacetum coccineum]